MDGTGGDPGSAGLEHREHRVGASSQGDRGNERVVVTRSHAAVLGYLASCSGPASERAIAERVLGRSWAAHERLGRVLEDLEGIGAIEAGPTFLRSSAVLRLGFDERQTWLATDAGRRAHFVYCHGERALVLPAGDGSRCSRCGGDHRWLLVDWRP